jgi:hypothetical protein
MLSAGNTSLIDLARPENMGIVFLLFLCFIGFYRSLKNNAHNILLFSFIVPLLISFLAPLLLQATVTAPFQTSRYAHYMLVPASFFAGTITTQYLKNGKMKIIFCLTILFVLISSFLTPLSLGHSLTKDQGFLWLLDNSPVIEFHLDKMDTKGYYYEPKFPKQYKAEILGKTIAWITLIEKNRAYTPLINTNIFERGVYLRSLQWTLKNIPPPTNSSKIYSNKEIDFYKEQ